MFTTSLEDNASLSLEIKNENGMPRKWNGDPLNVVVGSSFGEVFFQVDG